MSTVYATEGRLRIDFTFKSVRIIEPLHMADNRDNRRLASAISRRLDASITAGVFNRAHYLEFFPRGKNAARLFGTPPTTGAAAEDDRIPTLGEFAEAWLQECRARVSRTTWEGYASQLRNHVFGAAIAQRPIREIHDGEINLFKGAMRDRGHSADLINKVLSRLRGIFKTAASRRIASEPLLETNPMPLIGNLRAHNPKPDPFSFDEVLRILDAARDWERGFLTLLFGTGMRPNEALALRWCDIDFTRRSIMVRRNRTRYGEGPVKTRRSEREVDMVPSVAIELGKQRERSGLIRGRDGLVFPADRGHSGEVVRAEFMRRHPKTGEPIKVREHRQKIKIPAGRRTAGRETAVSLGNFLRRNWKRVLASAGVRERPLYQCRHTFAVLLIEQGENVRYIAEQMGHANLQPLTERYAGWSRKPQRLLTEGIDQVLRGSGVQHKLFRGGEE